jgi:hypothetical protein
MVTMRGPGLLIASACLALAVSGCAKSGPSPEEAGPSRAGTPPPATSPMARVQPGMRPEEVVKILGAPSHQKAYPSGKAWIPWYFGPDRWRAAYFYKGMGRVIFKGEGGFSTGSSVLRVEYDPHEPG